MENGIDYRRGELENIDRYVTVCFQYASTKWPQAVYELLRRERGIRPILRD